MTETQKRRQELFNIIKNNNELKETIREDFGLPYTSVSNKDLESYVNAFDHNDNCYCIGCDNDIDVKPNIVEKLVAQVKKLSSVLNINCDL